MINRDLELGVRVRTAVDSRLEEWFSRMHGYLTFKITQIMTGYDCFNQYLFKISKTQLPMCAHWIEIDSA